MNDISRPRGRPVRSDFILHKTDDVFLSQIRPDYVAALKAVHGGSRYAAAAEKLGIPINTLKTRVHHARRQVIEMRSKAEKLSGGLAGDTVNPG